MSDSRELDRITMEPDCIIAMYFCGQTIDRREFIDGLYVVICKWGNA